MLQLSKTIRELDLAGNAIGDEVVEIVCKALKQKTKQQLRALNLSDNKITSAGCLVICYLVSRCKTVEELQLQNNQIDNVGAE